jgi:hypothetical protein
MQALSQHRVDKQDAMVLLERRREMFKGSAAVASSRSDTVLLMFALLMTTFAFGSLL